MQHGIFILGFIKCIDNLRKERFKIIKIIQDTSMILK